MMGKDNQLGNKELFDLDFLAEEVEVVKHKILTPYKVIIADDDIEMHSATKILLRDFVFEDRRLEFIDVFSGKEAMKAVEAHPDTAIILLDVVMEDADSGLKVVNYIRKELLNKNIRIILRTGQPGEAPEERIIVDYDINDYRLKTELTVQRLYTSMYEALRSYRDIRTLEHHKQGLEKIIEVSATLFSQGSLKTFYNCVLSQLMTFRNESSVYFRERQSGVAFHEEESDEFFGVIIAATGRFEDLVGQSIQDIPELLQVKETLMARSFNKNFEITETETGFIISRFVTNHIQSVIFIEAEAFDFDIDLMNTLLYHYSDAFDNYISRILRV